MIEIQQLEVGYGNKPPVLQIEQLSIAEGERVAVIGASGEGKTTLLRSIRGSARPRHGSIRVLGVDLWAGSRAERQRVNRRIAIIFQQFHLAQRLTVLTNVLCGRLGVTGRLASLLGWFTEEDRRIAWAAIQEVGLEPLVHQRAEMLSGGEQQRLAVARALAQQPSIILADEPVSSLDPAWAEDVLKMLVGIQAKRRATLVMSLHQPSLALRFASRILALRGARLIFDGPPGALSDELLADIYRGDRTVDSAHDFLSGAFPVMAAEWS